MKLIKNLGKSVKLMEEYKPYLFYLTPFNKPILRKGEGTWVEDVDGNRYLDLMSGQFSLPLGHAKKEFVEFLKTQAENILHTNNYYLTLEVLKGAKEVASLTSGDLKKVTFLSTGAEAIEFAIRHAKFYTQKEGIVSLTKGYHGLTLATQSISNEGIYAKPIVPKSYHIPVPDFINKSQGMDLEKYIDLVLEKSKKLLEEYKGQIAAFVLEPVISVGGMIFPPKKYFQGISKLIKEHNALLIFDECQTGLGRTGKWFGYEHFAILPDILVLAKSAGLGLPTSIVVMRDEIAAKLEGKIMHFSSHQNDPISGASVSFLINYIKQHLLLEKINKKGNYFINELIKLSKECPLLKNPRGLGLMIGFDLPKELFSDNFNPGKELSMLLEENGVLIQAVQRGHTFRVLPSYEISNEEIDYFTDVLKKCMKLLEEKVAKLSKINA